MKKLTLKFPNKCTGCELCVLEAQRQLSVVGIEESLIRIFRDTDKKTNKPLFCIELDPRVNELDIACIKQICPEGVFEVTEEEQQIHEK